MRILLSSTAYPPSIGGGQLYAHQLMRHMSESHHQAQVVTHWDETRTDWLLGTTLRMPSHPMTYEIDGVLVTRLGSPAKMRRKMLPWVVSYYLATGVAINRIAAMLADVMEGCTESSDLVHNVRIGRAGLSFASLELARRWDVPFVLTPLHHHPRWSRFPYRHYHRLYRLADGVIALTPTEKRVLTMLGVEEERITVTGMGPIVSDAPEPERFRKHYGVDGPMILFLGQKFRYKGSQSVLEAAPYVWKTFPDAYFVFIGPRTAYSKKLFSSWDDRRIIEIGAVSLEEKTDALAACDLLCVPSSQESFGAVYLEAWAFEKPVIAGSAVAVADVVEDGFDGFRLMPVAQEIADRICILLHDQTLRDTMGARGKQRLIAHFVWEKLAAKTEAVYEQLQGG